MDSTRPARRLIAGVGIAIAALTLAACAGGAAGSADPTEPAGSSAKDARPSQDSASDAPPVDDGAGLAAGIVESGSGEADPELVGLADDADRPLANRIAGKSYTPRAAEGFTFVDPAAVTFTFPAADQISIVGGCNAQFGDLEWDGESVKAPTLASTLMACDQPLMDQDTALSTLLSGGVVASLDGDVLTLAADGVTIELVERAAPEAGGGAVGVPDPGVTSTAQAD
jgi:heat shock protein HslJ